MDTKKYLDLVGLKHYDSKIKTFIANSITDAEAVYTDSLVKKDENGVVLNPWQIITDDTLLNQAPTSKAVLDYVGTFAKSVKDTVEGLSVNNKTFGNTGAVVLYAGDIAMSNTDATTIKDEIDALKGAVSGGVHFIGISTTTITDGGVEKPTIEGETYENLSAGDVVIYQTIVDGNVESEKEFIWTGSKWAELGDTTADGKRLTALEDRMTTAERDIDALEGRMDQIIDEYIDGMDASFTLDAEGTGEGEVAVVTGVNLTQVDGKITDMTVDSAKAATKVYVDGRFDALDATETATATATDLVTDEIAVITGVTVSQEDGLITSVSVDSAKAATTVYVDNKVKDITDGNYVKSFDGKTGDITLSAEGNVTLEMVDNALKASYDDTNVDGISWKETQAITTDEIDALFA